MKGCQDEQLVEWAEGCKRERDASRDSRGTEHKVFS